MSESLGEAVLTIRTDDGTFYTDVQRSRGASEQLGTSMDQTSGSSSRLANEMRTTARSADSLGDAMVRQRQRGRENIASLGAQRAGMQQLSFQIGDISQQYTLGIRPQVIFAQQAGQVVQALQLMTGSSKGVLAWLGGPWGIALTSAAVVLTPFIAKLFEASDAAREAEEASRELADQQTDLANFFDLATGAIKEQNRALIENAILKRQMQADEIRERRELRKEQIRDIVREGSSDRPRQFSSQFSANVDMASIRGERGNQALVNATRGGDLDANLRSIATSNSPNANRAAQILELRALNVTDAAEISKIEREAQSLISGELDPELRTPGRTRRSRSRSSGPSQEDIDARFERDLISVTQSILSARLQTARSAEERAEIQARQVEWDRRVRLADIEADDNLKEAQRAELEAATNRLADAELEAIEFAKTAQIEGDMQALADERFRAETAALQDQLTLADTEAGRKSIALKLLEAQEAHLRATLETVILSETANERERQSAEIALRALREGAGQRRAAVERANETTVERYLRDLNRSPEQINEALDGIRIDGLEALNDGLVDAIRGVESLGDVFKSVADQIIADLLRIAIQQSIIRPLAGAIFGGVGGGGPIDLLSQSSLFAGGFASGGLIPNGQFGIVGEEGAELAAAENGGVRIFSNSDSRRMLGQGSGGVSISMPISMDATGADRAALERLSGRIDRLQQSLPSVVVQTIQDAGERGVLSTGNWR